MWAKRDLRSPQSFQVASKLRLKGRCPCNRLAGRGHPQRHALLHLQHLQVRVCCPLPPHQCLRQVFGPHYFVAPPGDMDGRMVICRARSTRRAELAGGGPVRIFLSGAIVEAQYLPYFTSGYQQRPPCPACHRLACGAGCNRMRGRPWEAGKAALPHPLCLVIAHGRAQPQ